MGNLNTDDHLHNIRMLCAKHRVRRLSVFGSVAEGAFDPVHSDVDLLVEFQPMPPVERARCYFGLIEDLEGLFNTPIDLVEQKAINNPFFGAAVERTKRLVFEAHA